MSETTPRVEKPEKYAVTGKDNLLERLSAERNQAYETLADLDTLARNLLSTEYASVGEHMLRIMYDEEK